MGAAGSGAEGGGPLGGASILGIRLLPVLGRLELGFGLDSTGGLGSVEWFEISSARRLGLSSFAAGDLKLDESRGSMLIAPVEGGRPSSADKVLVSHPGEPTGVAILLPPCPLPAYSRSSSKIGSAVEVVTIAGAPRS